MIVYTAYRGKKKMIVLFSQFFMVLFHLMRLQTLSNRMIKIMIARHRSAGRNAAVICAIALGFSLAVYSEEVI